MNWRRPVDNGDASANWSVRSTHVTTRYSVPPQTSPPTGVNHPVSSVGDPRIDPTYAMTPSASAPNDSSPRPSADRVRPTTAGMVGVVLGGVVVVGGDVEGAVVVGGCVVVVETTVVVATELDVLSPLTRLSLHEERSAPIRATVPTDRRRFMGEVCQTRSG